MHAVLLILQQLAGFAWREGQQWAAWAKQFAVRLARASRAFLVWATAFATARAALFVAITAAFEVVTVYITTRVVTPIAGDFIERCVPAGQIGDGFIWLVWDTGINAKAAFNAFVIYIANYTALWRVFSVYLRAQAVALSAYRAAQKRAKAIRDASIL